MNRQELEDAVLAGTWKLATMHVTAKKDLAAQRRAQRLLKRILASPPFSYKSEEARAFFMSHGRWPT